MSNKLPTQATANDKEVIVFIHGLGASKSSWDEQALFFKENYELLIPDMRGHGQTPLGDEKFDFELCADDIYRLIESKNISKVHLCGFSMGGMVAFEFACKYPDKVSSLTVINTLASFNLPSIKLKLIYALRIALITLFPLATLAKLMGKKLFRDKDQHLRDRLIDLSSKANKKGYLQGIKAMPNWSVMDKIDTIKATTLLVGSEFDYSIYDGKQELAKSMKDFIRKKVY
jgi:3-oxoadipate enol-lactonase